MSVITIRRNAVTFLAAGCFFMENLDGTIVTTTTPRIARDLELVPYRIAFLAITVFPLIEAMLVSRTVGRTLTAAS